MRQYYRGNYEDNSELSDVYTFAMFTGQIKVINDDNDANQADVNFQYPIANQSQVKVQCELKRKLGASNNNSSHIISSTLDTFSTFDCENDEQNSVVEQEISDNDDSIRASDISIPKKIEISITMEDIELEFLKHHRELDIALIEEDAVSSFPLNQNKCSSYLQIPGREEDQNRSAFCYTPERLVRSQEYRILTPSPRYFFETTSPTMSHSLRDTPSPFHDPSPRKSVLRNRLGELIDSSHIGALNLEALLDPGAPEIRVPLSIRRPQRPRALHPKRESKNHVTEDVLEIANRESPVPYETPDLTSSDSSIYGDLNNIFEEQRRSPGEDSLEIQIDDGSPSELPCQSPVCLLHELTNVSALSECQHQDSGVLSQVVSILEGLQRNSIASIDSGYSINDRFSTIASTHDRLTRFALSIEEEDENVVSIEEDSTTLGLFSELQEKVKQLEENSRDIYRDIGLLKVDFQCEERKIDHLQNETTRLHRDVNEFRYLDDLLNLLRGELARISRRNWPFILGHSECNNEEINLVV